MNTAQQIGGSVGTAMLNTIATSATSDYLRDHARRMTPDTAKDGLVEGFSHAFVWSSVILAAAAVAVGVLMNTPRPPRDKAAQAAPSAAVHLG